MSSSWATVLLFVVEEQNRAQVTTPSPPMRSEPAMRTLAF